jgi:hypothetical protein
MIIAPPGHHADRRDDGADPPLPDLTWADATPGQPGWRNGRRPPTQARAPASADDDVIKTDGVRAVNHVSLDIASRDSSCSGHRAAARPPCCERWPASRMPDPAASFLMDATCRAAALRAADQHDVPVVRPFPHLSVGQHRLRAAARWDGKGSRWQSASRRCSGSFSLTASPAASRTSLAASSSASPRRAAGQAALLLLLDEPLGATRSCARKRRSSWSTSSRKSGSPAMVTHDQKR